jgi:hypothetical protein
MASRHDTTARAMTLARDALAVDPGAVAGRSFPLR